MRVERTVRRRQRPRMGSVAVQHAFGHDRPTRQCARIGAEAIRLQPLGDDHAADPDRMSGRVGGLVHRNVRGIGAQQFGPPHETGAKSRGEIDEALRRPIGEGRRRRLRATLAIVGP